MSRRCFDEKTGSLDEIHRFCIRPWVGVKTAQPKVSGIEQLFSSAVEREGHL
jgi:hypothetical protein